MSLQENKFYSQPQELASRETFGEKAKRYSINIIGGTAIASTALTGYNFVTNSDTPESLRVTETNSSNDQESYASEDIFQSNELQDFQPQASSYRDIVTLHSTIPVSGDAASFDIPQIDTASVQTIAENTLETAAGLSDVKITFAIDATTSDESRADSLNGDGNLGKPSHNNQMLAEGIAGAADDSLNDALDTFSLEDSYDISTTASGRERILDTSEVAEVQRIADELSMTAVELTSAHNDKRLELNNPEHVDTVVNLLDDARKLTITATIEHSKTMLQNSEPLADTVKEDVNNDDTDSTVHGIYALPFALPLKRRKNRTPNARLQQLKYRVRRRMKYELDSMSNERARKWHNFNDKPAVMGLKRTAKKIKRIASI